jgi:hypothetical protein
MGKTRLTSSRPSVLSYGCGKLGTCPRVCP